MGMDRKVGASVDVRGGQGDGAARELRMDWAGPSLEATSEAAAMRLGSTAGASLA